MVSRFYDDLKTSDKKIIAKELYNSIPKAISSYLICCTGLRNICAHYDRIYYKIFPTSIFDNNMGEKLKRTFWEQIQAVKYLFPDKTTWNEQFIPKLQKLFNKYSNFIELKHISFPENWHELLLL